MPASALPYSPLVRTTRQANANSSIAIQTRRGAGRARLLPDVGFLQEPDDLLFGESALPHLVLASPRLRPRTVNYASDSFAGRIAYPERYPYLLRVMPRRAALRLCLGVRTVFCFGL